jgi:secondary thiamine-phosphate synthase enzyme
MSELSVRSKAHEEVIDITAEVAAMPASLHGLVPQSAAYVHDVADHVRAHVLSALVGPSVSVPVREGTLRLGRFQRIVLVEFEGPRERSIEVSGTWS